MVQLKFSIWIIAVVAGLASTILGQQSDNWNPTGEGCVDPQGYLSCYADQSSTVVGCTENCNSTTAIGTQENQQCILGCNGFYLASKIGCWVQSCWNQVYSCEYQLTAADYFHQTGLVQNARVPFYPPPDDATEGACSCNLGYVYGNMSRIEQNNCLNTISAGGDADSCQCCQFSAAVSNILSTCPKSNLDIMQINETIADAQSLLIDGRYNCAILDAGSPADCTAFGFQYYGDKIFNPLNLPAGEPGSEPLSNLPGNAFTEPGDGAFTLELEPGYSSIISLAPFKADAGVATATADGSALETETAAATGTGSGKATSAATEKTTGTGSAASPTKTNNGSLIQMSVMWAVIVSITAVLVC